MNNAELIEKLKTINEVLLLELLEITSEDLVDAFYDRVLEKNDYIRQEIEE